VITSIAVKKGCSDRVAVRLDGELAFDLAAQVAGEAGLRVGDLLSEEAQEHLLSLDAPFRARNKALALLSLRDRSRREVEIRLKTAGFDPEIISATVDWLEGLDYLDDERFIAGYVSEKFRGGWGPQRVRAELLRKGVERRLIDEHLGSEREDFSAAAASEGLEAVTALARRRFGRQFRDDQATAARRLSGFLARRGYDWDSINAIAQILSREAEEGEGRGENVPSGGGVSRSDGVDGSDGEDGGGGEGPVS
jgi:regulatory protein